MAVQEIILKDQSFKRDLSLEEDNLLPQKSISIRLDAFEGPLDLLIYLIQRHEIDIYDIPLRLLTAQYLKALNQLQESKLEIAGEFFVMAATLMHIKSKMLLPQEEKNDSVAEEDNDPRWELVEQLLEYKKIKIQSHILESLIYHREPHVKRLCESDISLKQRTLLGSDKIEIWHWFNECLKRIAHKIEIGTIERERISVADRMDYLINRLKSEKTFTFCSIFENELSLEVIVATFLALLELARLNLVKIDQNKSFEDILCHFINPL